MPRGKFTGVALPAVVGTMPLVVAGVRAVTTHAAILFWGDQALIDIEARNSLLGRNLLGVYDRYGWHHLGPMWLLVLGVFRWLGGGSTLAVVFGSYMVQAAAAAAIVVVASRLGTGLTAWWAALLVLGYEWSFGLERLGTVWAPYAIALPAALLVLLVADVAVSRKPWAPTIGTAVCATFLCQTDISTVVLVAALVVVTPVLRLAAHVRRRAPARGRSAARGRWPVATGWGWSGGSWRFGAGTLLVLVAVFWLSPVIQQLTTRPGNLVAVYRFLSSHPARQTWDSSVKAAGTIFGSFPFRLGAEAAKRDDKPSWLFSGSLDRRPWYLVYLLLTALAGIYAMVRGKRAAFALATASVIAMLAAGWSVHLVYGPLYPYLVIWIGALAVPAWLAGWLALAPPVAAARRDRADAAVRHLLSLRRARRALPLASGALAIAVSTAFVLGPVPMTGTPSQLARHSWEAVAREALAPGVKTVYVDIVSTDAMPEAAAIADQAIHHGLRVELNRAALYFLDPSFAPRSVAQLSIVVCCARNDPGTAPAGLKFLKFRRKVGDERIYTSFADRRSVAPSRSRRSVRRRPGRSDPSGPGRSGRP